MYEEKTTRQSILPPIPGVDSYRVTWGPPRLLTRHMLLWVALAGPLIFFTKFVNGRLNSWPFDFSPLFFVLAIFFAIVAAAVFVVLGIAINSRRRGHAFFDEPGQWLVIEMALRAVFYIVFACVVVVMDSVQRSGQWRRAYDVVPIGLFVFGWALLSIVDVRAAFYGGDSKTWRSLFLAKALFPVLALLPYVAFDEEIVLFGLQLPAQVMLLSLSLLAAIQDARWKFQRHWTHWFGWVSHLLLNAIMIAGTVLLFLS